MLPLVMMRWSNSDTVGEAGAPTGDPREASVTEGPPILQQCAGEDAKPSHGIVSESLQIHACYYKFFLF